MPKSELTFRNKNDLYENLINGAISVESIENFDFTSENKEISCLRKKNPPKNCFFHAHFYQYVI